LPIVLLVLIFIRQILSSVATLTEIMSGIGSKTLYELKVDIGKRLARLGKHIVVLVDDLDRLPPKDTCEMFQIVKNNGDIQNLSYVLAFDDDVVKEVLRKEYSEQYQNFTEKIVQIAFTLPPPDRVVLGDYFIDKLNPVLTLLPDSGNEYWSKDRWSNYYYLYFRHFFSTFREVKRIINGIRLNIELIGDGDVIEVNPIDFVAIEIIRVQFPQVYEYLRSHAGVFVNFDDPLDPLRLDDDEFESAEKSYGEMLKAVPDDRRKPLDELLRDLFPGLGHSIKSWSPSDEQTDDWIAELRICSPKVFDRYLLYGNYEGDVPNAEVRGLIRNLGRTDVMVQMLEKYY